MIFFNTEAAITAYEETTRGFRLDHYDYRVVPVAMDRNNTSYYCRHDLHGSGQPKHNSLRMVLFHLDSIKWINSC